MMTNGRVQTNPTRLLDELTLLAGQFDPDLSRLDVQHLQQEVKDISGLYNLAVSVGAGLNLEEVIWMLYKESSRLIATDNFAIVVYNSQSDCLSFDLVFNRGQRVRPRAVKLANNRGLAGRVLTSRRPLLVNDLPVTKQPESKQADQPQPEKSIRSWLGVPILNPALPQARALGVIAIWSCKPDAFTDRDLWLLSAIATQAAIAFRNARLYEGLLAERDRVVEADKEVRRELARDLHDGPTQLVSAIALHLDFCSLTLENDPALVSEELKAARELAGQAVNQIRSLLFELRPLTLEMQGLAAALQAFLEQRQKEIIGATSLRLKIKTDNPDDEISRQDEKVEAAIFAIVQEAVNNALKHAQAGEIVVELGETPAHLYATVTDNGRGFDVGRVLSNYDKQFSLGMLNLRERAELIGGDLTLKSAPGRGTRVAVSVPKAETERRKKRGKTGPLAPVFKLMLEE